MESRPSLLDLLRHARDEADRLLLRVRVRVGVRVRVEV